MNKIDLSSLNISPQKKEKNKIDVAQYTFQLNSSRFRKSLQKETIPKALLEDVKEFLKQEHRDIVRAAFGDTEVKRQLSNIISNYISSKKITEQFKNNLGDLDHNELVLAIVDDIAGFGPLEYLLDIPTITDININAYNNIWIDDYKTGPKKIEAKFDNKDVYKTFISKILNESGTSLNYKKPQASGSLEKLRFDIVGEDLSPDITCSIRIHSKDLRISRNGVVNTNQASEEIMVFLEEVMKSRISMVVSGATGAGKTEFMRLLAGFIPKRKRIVTIEDTKELYLEYLYGQTHNIAHWLTRKNMNDKEIKWNIGDLVEVALRHYPKWIFIGEARGSELYHILKAAQTDHSILTGIHANQAEEQFSRMITLLNEYHPSTDEAYGQKLAENLNLGIHMGRVGENENRTLLKLVEFEGFENGKTLYRTLYEFDEKTQTHVQVNTLSEKMTKQLLAEPFVNLEKIQGMLAQLKQTREVFV